MPQSTCYQQLNFGLFEPKPKKPNTEPDWDNLTTEELKNYAWIPNGRFPKKDQAKHIALWLKANKVAYKRIAKQECKEFQARGSAQTWFSLWKPNSSTMQEVADGIESALDVLDNLYPRILNRGINHPEDMGLLQADRCGKTEGIRVKKESYSENILIQIRSISGPHNFDPQEKSLQMEPGAKGHLFLLAYQSLPKFEDLEADLCVYPIIRNPSNNFLIKGKENKYHSEGFLSPKYFNQGFPLHNSWNSLSPTEQQKLIALTNL